MTEQTVRGARQALLQQHIALANLALLDYTSVALRLEGVFASTLQLLFGAVAILAGSFAYLSFPGIPATGRIIVVVSLQPGAILLTTVTGCALVFGQERSRRRTRITYGRLLASGDGLPALLDEIDESIKVARSTLAARQSWLRLALWAGGGWIALSLAVVYVVNWWWPNLLNSIEQSHIPVAFMSLATLGLVALFAGISSLRRKWTARRVTSLRSRR